MGKEFKILYVNGLTLRSQVSSFSYDLCLSFFICRALENIAVVTIIAVVAIMTVIVAIM